MDINNRPTGSEIPRGWGWGSEEGIYLGWGGIVTIRKKSTLDKEVRPRDLVMSIGTKSGTVNAERGGVRVFFFVPPPTACLSRVAECKQSGSG